MMYLAPESFAASMGIGVRAAQVAFRNAADGKPWKGHHLPVIAIKGQSVGAGGKVWALAVDRCPAELKAKLGVFESPFEAPIQGELNGKVEPLQWAEQADRLRIIRPVLDLPKRSAERVEAFRRIAAERNVVRGCPTRLADTTIRDWVRLHELQGPAGLIPALPADKGKARVTFTRGWDAGIDLRMDRRAALAARVTRIAQSLVATDGRSIRETLRLCSDHLCRLSADAGSQLPVPVLRGLCQLNVKWAERADLERYRLSYLARKDHKRHQDKTVGRASLALADRPMSLLQGDVHYADIAVEDQAEPVRLRLIAWLDMSSLFLWVTPVLLSKGQGIVQADVGESLAYVTMCPHEGIPEHFYLDNGGEYSALAEAMRRLEYLAQDQFGLTLAKPYFEGVDRGPFQHP